MNMDMNMVQAVLFDLDGTLADTALDLGGALNKLLKKNGFPEKSIDEIRPFAGHGSAGLIKMGANIGAEHPDFETWKTNYLNIYNQCFMDKTNWFAGVEYLLAELTQRGIKWGIITNKNQKFTEPLVQKLMRELEEVGVNVGVVVSGDTCSKPKPSTEPMFFACEKLGVQPEKCVYVGDAERDMQAGKNAGMQTILAEWGYIADTDNTDEWLWDYSARNPLEVLDILDIMSNNQ